MKALGEAIGWILAIFAVLGVLHLAAVIESNGLKRADEQRGHHGN